MSLQFRCIQNMHANTDNLAFSVLFHVRVHCMLKHHRCSTCPPFVPQQRRSHTWYRLHAVSDFIAYYGIPVSSMRSSSRCVHTTNKRNSERIRGKQRCDACSDHPVLWRQNRRASVHTTDKRNSERIRGKQRCDACSDHPVL